MSVFFRYLKLMRDTHLAACRVDAGYVIVVAAGCFWKALCHRGQSEGLGVERPGLQVQPLSSLPRAAHLKCLSGHHITVPTVDSFEFPIYHILMLLSNAIKMFKK